MDIGYDPVLSDYESEREQSRHLSIRLITIHICDRAIIEKKDK